MKERDYQVSMAIDQDEGNTAIIPKENYKLLEGCLPFY
jgi:hypothetical protein